MDTLIPDPPPRSSLIPRLRWWQNAKGAWISDVLDTTQPECVGIFETGNGDVALVVWRKKDFPRARMHTLGTFADPEAAKEFARDLVGDKTIQNTSAPRRPEGMP